MEWWGWLLVAVYAIGWFVSFYKIWELCENPTSSFWRAILIFVIVSVVSTWWPFSLIARPIGNIKKPFVRTVVDNLFLATCVLGGYLIAIFVWPSNRDFSWSSVIFMPLAFVVGYNMSKLIRYIKKRYQEKKQKTATV